LRALWLNEFALAGDLNRRAVLETAAGGTPAHPLLPVARPAIAFLQRLNRVIRRVSRFTHRLQGAIEGHYDRRRMWFDHYVDVNWKLPTDGDVLFLERGLFNRLLLASDADVLEIACGDGYYTAHFYAPRARSVVAVDVDPSALTFARRSNGRPNIRYQLHDIRSGLPAGEFSHVIWDSGMLYLTLEQVDSIIGWIRDRVGPDGILSGHTYTDYVEERPYIRHRLRDSNDVIKLIGAHFDNVAVLSTQHPDRTNFYFVASDAVLPPPGGPTGLFYARAAGDQPRSVDVRTVRAPS
jgi:SAM-dependent methyltransferase